MDINTSRLIAMSIAESLDYFRVIPRIILICYAYMMYEITQWFMLLPEPNTEQAGFVVSVIGVAGIIISLYQKSGKDWNLPINIWKK